MTFNNIDEAAQALIAEVDQCAHNCVPSLMGEFQTRVESLLGGDQSLLRQEAAKALLTAENPEEAKAIFRNAIKSTVGSDAESESILLEHVNLDAWMQRVSPMSVEKAISGLEQPVHAGPEAEKFHTKSVFRADLLNQGLALLAEFYEGPIPDKAKNLLEQEIDKVLDAKYEKWEKDHKSECEQERIGNVQAAISGLEQPVHAGPEAEKFHTKSVFRADLLSQGLALLAEFYEGPIPDKAKNLLEQEIDKVLDAKYEKWEKDHKSECEQERIGNVQAAISGLEQPVHAGPEAEKFHTKSVFRADLLNQGLALLAEFYEGPIPDKAKNLLEQEIDKVLDAKYEKWEKDHKSECEQERIGNVQAAISGLEQPVHAGPEAEKFHTKSVFRADLLNQGLALLAEFYEGPIPDKAKNLLEQEIDKVLDAKYEKWEKDHKSECEQERIGNVQAAISGLEQPVHAGPEAEKFHTKSVFRADLLNQGLALLAEFYEGPIPDKAKNLLEQEIDKVLDAKYEKWEKDHKSECEQERIGNVQAAISGLEQPVHAGPEAEKFHTKSVFRADLLSQGLALLAEFYEGPIPDKAKNLLEQEIDKVLDAKYEKWEKDHKSECEQERIGNVQAAISGLEQPVHAGPEAEKFHTKSVFRADLLNQGLALLAEFYEGPIPDKAKNLLEQEIDKVLDAKYEKWEKDHKSECEQERIGNVQAAISGLEQPVHAGPEAEKFHTKSVFRADLLNQGLALLAEFYEGPIPDKAKNLLEQEIDKVLDAKYQAWEENYNKVKKEESDKKLREAKSVSLTFLVLSQQDLANESFKDLRVFGAAMRNRIDHLYKDLPEDRRKELEDHITKIIRDLHDEWEHEHEQNEELKEAQLIGDINKRLDAIDDQELFLLAGRKPDFYGLLENRVRDILDRHEGTNIGKNLKGHCQDRFREVFAKHLRTYEQAVARCQSEIERLDFDERELQESHTQESFVRLMRSKLQSLAVFKDEVPAELENRLQGHIGSLFQRWGQQKANLEQEEKNRLAKQAEEQQEPETEEEEAEVAEEKAEAEDAKADSDEEAEKPQDLAKIARTIDAALVLSQAELSKLPLNGQRFTEFMKKRAQTALRDIFPDGKIPNQFRRSIDDGVANAWQKHLNIAVGATTRDIQQYIAIPADQSLKDATTFAAWLQAKLPSLARFSAQGALPPRLMQALEAKRSHYREAQKNTGKMVEATVRKWSPPDDIATYTHFKAAFLEQSGNADIARKHAEPIESLLLQKWLLYRAGAKLPSKAEGQDIDERQLRILKRLKPGEPTLDIELGEPLEVTAALEQLTSAEIVEQKKSQLQVAAGLDWKRVEAQLGLSEKQSELMVNRFALLMQSSGMRTLLLDGTRASRFGPFMLGLCATAEGSQFMTMMQVLRTERDFNRIPTLLRDHTGLQQVMSRLSSLQPGLRTEFERGLQLMRIAEEEPDAETELQPDLPSETVVDMEEGVEYELEPEVVEEPLINAEEISVLINEQVHPDGSERLWQMLGASPAVQSLVRGRESNFAPFLAAYFDTLSAAQFEACQFMLTRGNMGAEQMLEMMFSDPDLHEKAMDIQVSAPSTWQAFQEGFGSLQSEEEPVENTFEYQSDINLEDEAFAQDIDQPIEAHIGEEMMTEDIDFVEDVAQTQLEVVFDHFPETDVLPDDSYEATDFGVAEDMVLDPDQITADLEPDVMAQEEDGMVEALTNFEEALIEPDMSLAAFMDQDQLATEEQPLFDDEIVAEDMVEVAEESDAIEDPMNEPVVQLDDSEEMVALEQDQTDDPFVPELFETEDLIGDEIIEGETDESQRMIEFELDAMAQEEGNSPFAEALRGIILSISDDIESHGIYETILQQLEQYDEIGLFETIEIDTNCPVEILRLTHRDVTISFVKQHLDFLLEPIAELDEEDEEAEIENLSETDELDTDEETIVDEMAEQNALEYISTIWPMAKMRGAEQKEDERFMSAMSLRTLLRRFKGAAKMRFPQLRVPLKIPCDYLETGVSNHAQVSEAMADFWFDCFTQEERISAVCFSTPTRQKNPKMLQLTMDVQGANQTFSRSFICVLEQEEVAIEGESLMLTKAGAAHEI